MKRRPIVAGQFYPADPSDLGVQIRDFLATELAGKRPQKHHDHLFGLMLPHAGYMYCGRIIGVTLSGVKLPRTLVIICPNHTGQGEPLGVWPEGEWLTPLGRVPVNAEFADVLCASGGNFSKDTLSHQREHSIEVLLPFLQSCIPTDTLSIVPVCVGTRNPDVLRAAGLALAQALKRQAQQGAETAVIVSSDMNHYEDEKRTIEKDNMALRAALDCDPEKLLKTVERENITMCGAGPLALALFAAKILGSPRVEQTAHDTSARASGDSRRVVGYAGLRLYCQQLVGSDGEDI